MDKKTIYAICIVLTGIMVGFLGELLPDSFKTGVQGVFPIPLSISFEFAWVMAVLITVSLSIWFVWKDAKKDTVMKQSTELDIKQSSGVLPKLTEAPTTQSLILESKTTAKNMKKEQILLLIDDDIDQAFEALDTIFLGKNATYKDLSKEYFERPDSFSLATYRAKLKRFVNVNWK